MQIDIPDDIVTKINKHVVSGRAESVEDVVVKAACAAARKLDDIASAIDAAEEGLRDLRSGRKLSASSSRALLDLRMLNED